MTKVFIDGSAGTTGLRIYERLLQRDDIELIKLSPEKRKDINSRRYAINSADIVFLCLPDEAAKESVSLVENQDTVIIDTSTAHRTDPNWDYGFPELSEQHYKRISLSKRIAVPGCHASGFISLIFPLIENNIIKKDLPLSCFSVTGYSGGGKKMISQYEDNTRDIKLSSPRQYGLLQNHKHLPEMKMVCKLDNYPIFSPIVADYYSGMIVTVPLYGKDIDNNLDLIRKIYKDKYNGPIVKYSEDCDENGFISSNKLTGMDNMEITVCGNDERVLLISRYDNLGKGASGGAIECMNIVMGEEITKGLIIGG